ncbi:uncharacterized protein LOC129921133 [Episyrphus balteatus]|uniref:uncharacterized protein LOC129921133 n=1 Tax=Episyrphus balteatus TaxID=286459 RepID=UPI0024861904|nr:uncharacterized protein LOC129921133 [Episyrphus balteatus]
MDLRVNKCCCMNLRTAGLFITWLNLIIIIIGSFVIIDRIIFLDNNPPPPRDYVFRPIVSSLALEIFTLVMYLFNAVVTALSLHGIYKNKHVMMLPYIILSGLGLIVTVPYLALIFIAAPYSNGPQIIGTIIAALLCAVMLGLMAWCWIVIYSLYHKIRDSVNKPMSYPYDI